MRQDAGLRRLAVDLGHPLRVVRDLAFPAAWADGKTGQTNPGTWTRALKPAGLVI